MRSRRLQRMWNGIAAMGAALVIALVGIMIGVDSHQPLAPALFGGGGSLVAMVMMRWGAFQMFPQLRRRIH